MPHILYSVEVEACDPDQLQLDKLDGIERIGGGYVGITVRLSSHSQAKLFHYVHENWGDVDFAAELVYGNIKRRPLHPAWEMAR